MTFEGAVVREQGVTFGIVVVRCHVLNTPHERENMVRFGRSAFGTMPIVLMAQDVNGTPTYWGRRDIVDFLASVALRRIPWRRYSVAA